ncbi:probable ubiquitin-conjugating enzyme E2 24 isoform X2 [Papaver somniferum]|uniref:probable ubiquitin-conjugating enzyme E2 24 isoform X2 n=1 Tax=Papaver somniferum TaxID=3469 RepID=UPI000E6F515B|nr:probable ubiquitin-conjugating enzyme E2 24 isoform X2 [Papaver somniferum]
MLAILRKPPKHFEEFVVQHFCSRAKSVLSACQVRDGQSKVDGYVTNGEHRIYGRISNTTAVSEELKGCTESMKSIYLKLDKAFTETPATKSLKDDCDTGNIIASDRDDKCPFDEKTNPSLTGNIHEA